MEEEDTSLTVNKKLDCFIDTDFNKYNKLSTEHKRVLKNCCCSKFNGRFW